MAVEAERGTDRSAAGSRRITLRLPASLARRLDACRARDPRTPRTTLLLQLLERGLTQAECRAGAARVAARPVSIPLPQRRLPAQTAVYLPASPYAALHGLRPRHHLALEHTLDAALEGDSVPPGVAPCALSADAGDPGVPCCPDYRLGEE